MDKVKEDKFIMKVDPLGNLHLSGYNFEIELYIYPNKSVTLKKGDAEIVKEDDDSYKVCITSDISRKLGRGAVMLNFVGYIPDPDFPDGYRTSIVERVCTGVML